jgi:hypothetical protein
VTVSTPESGEAATTSCPRWRSTVTSLDPMNPVPPDHDDFHVPSRVLPVTGARGGALRTHVGPSLQNDASIRPPVREKVDCTMVSGIRQFGVLFLLCDFFFDYDYRFVQRTDKDQHHRTIALPAQF